jgi:hypothetical protein
MLATFKPRMKHTYWPVHVVSFSTEYPFFLCNAADVLDEASDVLGTGINTVSAYRRKDIKQVSRHSGNVVVNITDV